jgi:hypothetical protein
MRRQIVKKQDQGNDGAVLLIVDEIIERIAALESERPAAFGARHRNPDRAQEDWAVERWREGPQDLQG